MKVVDTYGINDGGLIITVELAEDRFVDVKFCKDGGPVYVMQNEDGSTVYDGGWPYKTYPEFVYDEKAVIAWLGDVKISREDFVPDVAPKLIQILQEDGVTLQQVSEELNYREHAGIQDGRAGWDDNLIDYPTAELERIETAWSEMERVSNKVRVAIESTDDYSEPGFFARLVDDNIRNDDGTYGRVVECYRIVRINESGRIDKFDERVFESVEGARAAVCADSRLELVSYDDLVHEAGKGLGVVIADATVRSKDAQSLVQRGQELGME